jgi:hypothetical protein
MDTASINGVFSLHFRARTWLSDIHISFYDEDSLMDPRLLDVIIGVSGFLVLIVLLALLPMVMMAGLAYIVAILVFIIFLSGAGYLVNDKII